MNIAIVPYGVLTLSSEYFIGPRKDYITTCIPLYEASVKGDWKTAKEILDKRPELVRYSITENGETALHVAASSEKWQINNFVNKLIAYMENTDLELKNNSSNTALCLAAAAGNLLMVSGMVRRNRDLVAITGSQGMTPLYMAAMFGSYEVVMYLYENSRNLRDDCWTHQQRDLLLLKCVENDMFGLTIHCQKIPAYFKDRKADALALLDIIWKSIAEKPKKEIDDILREPPDDPTNQDEKPASDKEDQTLQQLKMLVETQNIVNEPAATTSYKDMDVQLLRNENKKYSSHILFIASEKGNNTTFIVKLIRQYPDLVWKVNDDNETIFHVAVRNHHVDIFNLLHEICIKRDVITLVNNKTGNNMLHLVGKSVARELLEDVSGAALQMQHELIWFREIELLIPPLYRLGRNKDGLTPSELFIKEHKDLVVEGEKWMKGTASQCMVVATLIATIVFAAAFTVPGGYNQNDGVPFFYQKASFVVFVVADAISLFLSSASILTFLSILTSRYAIRDFFELLPRKLMLGLATLYLSITTMMISFSFSFFVLYHNDFKWIPILISLIAIMPILLFAMLQYHLLKDVIFSAYSSRNVFRPKKHVLYYEDSMSNQRQFPFTIPFISRCTSKILKLL